MFISFEKYFDRNIDFAGLPGQVPSLDNLKSTAKSAKEKLKQILLTKNGFGIYMNLYLPAF